MRYLLLLLLTVSAYAQGPAREVHLRMMAFQNKGIPKECFAFDPAAPPGAAGTVAPVKGYLNHQSVKMVVTGNDVLFSKSANLADLSKPEFQLGKVTLPKAGNHFILVFLPNGDKGFHVMPLDDAVREFPLGAYRIINLSATPVKLTLEDKAYEFKAGQTSLIQDPPMRANNHAAMYAYSFIDGKWARIGSGAWPRQSRTRSIQIFWDNPGSRRTELRGFQDISPPE